MMTSLRIKSVKKYVCMFVLIVLFFGNSLYGVEDKKEQDFTRSFVLMTSFVASSSSVLVHTQSENSFLRPITTMTAFLSAGVFMDEYLNLGVVKKYFIYPENAEKKDKERIHRHITFLCAGLAGLMLAHPAYKTLRWIFPHASPLSLVRKLTSHEALVFFLSSDFLLR